MISVANYNIMIVVMYIRIYVLKLGHLRGSHKCAMNLRSGFLPSGNLTPHLLSTSFTNRSDDA